MSDERDLPPVRIDGAVLVISPSFFGYEHDIVEAFKRAAGAVAFLDERPGNSSWLRAALRLHLPLTNVLVERHFRRALRRLRAKRISLVLVVKGESCPSWFLEQIRRENPSVRIVFYAYDRIRDGDNCLALIPLCDAAYSFDSADVERRGLRYKPLFHGPLFHEAPEPEDRKWDVSFVGTAHSDRYAYATSIARLVDRAYLFFYAQARWFFALQKYAGGFRHVPWSAISFEKMPKHEVARVFRESRAVIDLQRTGQTGLTMRTFEVLASGARLITTNPAADRIEGVAPGSVLVLAVDDVEQSADRIRRFIEAPIPDRITDGRYSLDSWVEGFIQDPRPGPEFGA